jgi:hypothetical protein
MREQAYLVMEQLTCKSHREESEFQNRPGCLSIQQERWQGRMFSSDDDLLGDFVFGKYAVGIEPRWWRIKSIGDFFYRAAALSSTLFLRGWW